MSETTTIAAPPALQALPRVIIEEDAFPIVRLLGRTLRDAAAGHALDELVQGSGVVAVRSHSTPQTATIAFGDGLAAVTGGIHGEPDASVVVDLDDRFALRADPIGDTALAAGVARALRPPLPHWRDAAQRFWQATRSIPGIPDVLVATAEDGPAGPETARFGEGTEEYRITGPADLLAGVFTGADDFIVSLAAGLRIQGTLSQLSVMTAASWKVRFDV